MTNDEGNWRSFLDTGLDWKKAAFSPEEKLTLLNWYRENHEQNETSHLSKFPAFMIEHDPSGFKGYRRYMIEIDRPRDGVSLPQAAHLLMFTYSYIALANEKGTLYVIVNARKLGASRGEVIDTIKLAALAGGPLGMNAAAELTDSYLREWPENSDERGLAWPEGWSANPDALRSGIDLETNTLTASELDSLKAWYRRIHGAVPSHVEALARLHPTALKTQRIRLERALGPTLPAQMVPLLMLQLAALRLWPKPMLRAAQLAKALGVRRHHIVETLFWAGTYADEMVMETAFDTLGDLIQGWE